MRSGALVVGLAVILLFTLAWSLPQAVEVYKEGNMNVVFLDNCELHYTENNGIYKGFILYPDKNVPFELNYLPDCSYGVCDVNAEWNSGAWLILTGNVDSYCVDGQCTELGTTVSDYKVFLGGGIKYDVEVKCAGSTMKKTFEFFPVTFVPTDRGVKVRVEAKCTAYTVCLDGKCGKHFIRLKVPKPGAFYDGLLVCNGKAVKRKVYVSWKTKEMVKKEINIPEKNLEINIPIPLPKPELNVEMNTQQSVLLPKLPVEKPLGVPLFLDRNGLEVNGRGKLIGRILKLSEVKPRVKVLADANVYVFVPDKNTSPPPAKDFFYIEGEGNEVRIRIEGSGKLLVWKFDGTKWNFLGEYNGVFELNVTDNGPYDLDPVVGRIKDPIGVGTGGLTISEYLSPKFVDAEENVTVYGHVEKNGTAVADNWINIFLDGNRLGGPTYMIGPSDWWDSGWKYRREIDISNPDGVDVNGVDVPIEINLLGLYLQGKLNRDASDLRFTTKDGVLLPFWVEGILTPLTPIPQSSDDGNALTKDVSCEDNPSFKYIVVDDLSGEAEAPLGWYTFSYDDSAWNIGNGPLGNTGGECTPALTAPPDDLFVRKTFYVPGPVEDGKLYLSIGGGVRCYLNENLILDDLNTDNNATYWNYTLDVSPYLREGSNLLACWVAVGGENNGTNPGYFDVQLELNYYERLGDVNVWVRVDVPAGGTTIYMYYGNPSATQAESLENTLYVYELNKDCGGSTTGGACSVTFDPTADLNLYNASFFRDQRFDYGVMDMWLSGDFGQYSTLNEYADVYYDNGGGATYVGQYTGTRDGCPDEHAVPTTTSSPPWPIEVKTWIQGVPSLTMTGDSSTGVNYQPTGCTYYYHFTWNLKALVVNTFVNTPTVTVGPEMMETTTDAAGDYSWTFRAPSTPGEHIVRVEVNDGVDSAAVQDVLFVRKDLKIFWADVLPRLTEKNYSVYVKSYNVSIDEVNLVVADANNNNLFTLSCSTTDSVVWLCDLNVLELNKGETYILKAEGYSLGTLVGFDAKYTTPDSRKLEEFSRERDVNIDENVIIEPDKITLTGILAGFSYRRPITVKNNLPQELNDVPVKVVIDTAALISTGKMRDDCGDVRFTDYDGATELPYYLEPHTCDTNTTVFWVKVPYLPPYETRTIYIYYGNKLVASASDGKEVFPFFDDFEDWNGWVQYGSGIVTQNCGEAWGGSCSLLKTANNDPNGGYKDLGFVLNRPFILEAEINRINYNGGQWDRVGVIDDNGNGYGFIYKHNLSEIGIDVRSGYASLSNTSTAASYNPYQEWYRISLTWDGSGGIVAQAWRSDGTPIGSYSITDTSYSSFTRVYVFGGYEYLVDELRIRYLLPAEPTTTVGAEEPVPTFEASSGSWLGGFSYRNPIIIENTTKAVSGYQLKVVVDTAALIAEGRMNIDCSDVRFTDSDGVTELPYYLEPGTCDTNETVFWVKVDLPLGEKNLYMYYGNPSASSASDPSLVFDFWEDFETWSGWIQYGSGVVSQDCTDAYTGSCSLIKTTNNDPNGGYKALGFTLDYPFVLEAEINRVNYSGGYWDRVGVIDDNGNGYGFIYKHDLSEVGVDVRANYTSASNTSASASYNPYQEWYRISLTWDGSGGIVAQAWRSDGTPIGSYSITDTSYSSFTRVYVFGGHDYRVDSLRIRKYLYPAPKVTIRFYEPRYAPRGEVTFKPINPYKLRLWTYLEANVDDVRDTRVTAYVYSSSDNNLLCSFDILPGLETYDISGCAKDTNSVYVKVELSTDDPHNTPVLRSLSLSWLEEGNILLIEPAQQYVFRNEGFVTSGLVEPGIDCNDVNAYLYFRTKGEPYSIEEYNYSQFSTLTYEENVTIGDDLRPAYLHPTLGYYYIPVEVNNPSGTTLSYYQVKVLIDTQTPISQGIMRSDCGDIRVVGPDYNAVPFWVNEATCNTSSTEIWVKLPSIPPGTSTFYIFFGRLDYTSVSDPDAVFDMEETLSGVCTDPQPNTADGTCSVVLAPAAGRAIAPYQPAGYGELNIFMAGDLDYGGASGLIGICNTGGYEKAAIQLNGACVGTFSTGYQDCTMRAAPNTPVDVRGILGTGTEINITATLDNQVNYDPGCGWDYNLYYDIRVKERNYVSPEPTTTPGTVVADVAQRAVYISDALDTGLTSPTWGSVTWTETVPPGGSIKVYMRSSPDKTTWSDWTEVNNGGVPDIPPAQYVEYNVIFITPQGSASTPVFDNFKLVYYAGSATWTLVGPTTDVVTLDNNPYLCGTITADGNCTPLWNTTAKVKGEIDLLMRVTSSCGFEGNSNVKIVYSFARTTIQNFAADKNVVAKGDPLTLTGKVVDELGNPVARRYVYFYDNGAYIGSTLTDDDGNFTFTFTVPITASIGYHTLTVKFLRDPVEYYWESNASITVKYSSRPKFLEVNVSPLVAGIGDDVNVTAVITDEVGIDTVTLEVNDGVTTYTLEMNGSGDTYTADFNDTWRAGVYTYTIRATNLDGITSEFNGTFEVKGYATFGVQVERNVYGAQENVLLSDDPYWPNPLGTYEILLDGEGWYGSDISVTTTVPTSYDPFDLLTSYTFLRADGVPFDVNYTTGIEGNALLLDGNGYVGIVTAPHFRPAREIALSAWFTIESNSGDRYLLSLTDTTTNDIYALYSPANTYSICADLRVGGTTYSACSSDLPTGWHHIVATYDGSILWLYVDGSLVAYTNAGGDINYAGYSEIMTIGGKFNGAGFQNGWVGKIDDVRIYTSFLTDTEVKALYGGKKVSKYPVGYWPFDDNSIDAEPHKENALIVNSVTATEKNITFLLPYLGVKNTATGSGVSFGPGKEGNAIYFNGSSLLTIDQTDFGYINTFAVALWVYPENNGVDLVSKGYPNNPSWDIRLNTDGTVSCILRDSGGTEYNVSSTTSLSLNTWYHVACVYDRFRLRVFVNGSLEGETYVNNYGAFTNTSDVNVGSGFIGYIDDLRIYHYPLAPEDVQNLYNGRNVPWGLSYYNNFDANDLNDMSEDWLVPLFSGGRTSGERAEAVSGTPVTLTGTVVKVVKRSAICNTGDTNISGYLYVDVQTGSGSTWSTVPPIPFNDLITNTKRTILPGTCLSVADLYNTSPWNTDGQPAGTYRVRMVLLARNGTPSDPNTYITLSDGRKVTDTSEFNIVSAKLSLSDLNHENLAEHNLNEYETTDTINWIDVYVKAEDSNALDVNVTLTLTDEYKVYAGFGPNQETKYYGTIPKNTVAVQRWDNGGSGYYIPADATPGTYAFYWLVEMNASNGPAVEDFTRYVTIHNLPSDFNSSAPTRIYYYDDVNNSGIYQFCMRNPWSAPLTDINITIHCPSGVGIYCEGLNSGTTTESLASLASGASACFEFNIIVTPSAVTGDYDFNVDVEYWNPAGDHKFWPNQQNRIIEIRKAGILEIIVDSYPTDVVRGEDNAVFITRAHNTGTVNDDNAWIAFKVYPPEWNVIESNTNGILISDVNAFISTLPPDANLDLNVTFDIPPEANLGPQTVRIETGTSTDINWGDFKVLTVTVWDRPDLNLTADDYNASVGEEINLIARLTYSDGVPIPNQRINFEKNGVPLGAAYTDANGYAVFTWDLSSESPGTYEINAIYEGNTSLYTLPANDIIIVRIGLKPEVNAWLSTYDTGYGMDVNIYADANDDQGIKRVWAEVNDPSGNVSEVNLSLLSGTTYVATINPWKEGNYTITVYAQDLYDSISSAPPLILHVSASARMGVETDKNFYLQGELVKLVSPSWWDINWAYRRPITIENNSGLSLTGYTVKVVFDANTLIHEGKLRYDLGDVRFVDDTNVLPYWWEEKNLSNDFVPRASDDTDVNTQDANCLANPTYKYYYCLDVCLPTGWYEVNYDDSGWSVGEAPFGNTGGECTTVLNTPPDDLFVRKWFYVPGIPHGGTLYIAVGGGVRCYVNGNLVIDQIATVTSAAYWNYTVDVSPYLHYGNNLVACWVANGGENAGGVTGYLDIRLDVNYTLTEDPNATFWVKVDLPAAEKNIYLYYGNPNATSLSDANSVFIFQSEINGECSGSTAGGSCGVVLPGNGYAFAPYQLPEVNLEFNMSGDFDLGGAYADPTSCVEDTSNERAAVYVNGVCYGTYSTGFQDCIDRMPSLWPKNVSSLLKSSLEINLVGDSFPQVNYDPGCGYYYHFKWTLRNVYLRPYVSPEPTASVGGEETLTGSYLIANRTFRGYLVGVIERNVGGTWVYVDTDFNDLATSTLRTFEANTLFDLSTVWSDWNTYGQPEGEYRARITVVGPDGSPLTYNGVPIEEWNTFIIGPPPVDVNIIDFRVYDVNGVVDPRTEGNLVDSGLEKTIYVSADRPYRIEIDVRVENGTWDINDSNVYHLDLNADWNVYDIWYVLPNGTELNGGTFDGNVEWNTTNGGSVDTGYTVTFKYLVDLNTMYAEERNTTIKITHPAFIERSDWVILKTYVPDTIPPQPTEYNLLNTETNEVGPEINVIRSFENARIYAYWNEDIGNAYVEYNGTSTALTTDTIVPDGNYTEYNFTVTSFWYLGPHVAKIHAADLSGNWNDDLNYLTIYVWGIADVSSIDVNDTNIYQSDTVEINCSVVDRTNSNSPVSNYPVNFYDNGSFIGTAYTDSNGVASLSYTFTTFGDHELKCVVEENRDLWYRVDPPNNEKNILLFVKETVPPEWNEVNYTAKVHRGEKLETNVHWTDNHLVDTVKLVITRFRYRKNVIIENNSGVEYNGAEINVVVDTAALIAAGKMRSDCGDVRFYLGNTELPYYLEPYTCDTNTTVFWVKLPSLPLGTTTLTMFYGNPDITSESNGFAVFHFFDDFEDFNGWVTYGTGEVVQDSTRAYEGNYSAHKITSNDPNGAYKDIGDILGRDIVLEAWIDRNSGYVGGYCDRIGIIDADGNGYGFGYCHDSTTGLFIDVRTNYNGTPQASNDTGADIKDAWYLAKLLITSDGNVTAEYYYGGVLQASTTYVENSYSSFSRVYIFGGYDYWVDLMRVRLLLKNVSVTLGPEEGASGAPGVLASYATYDKNDVWAYLTWTVPSDEPLGLHLWYQEANDPSGNITDTNAFEFNVWGWSGITASSVSSASVPPDTNVTLYCKVEDLNLGIPIPGYSVSFYWDGNYIGSSDTNSTGWAAFEYNVGNNLGLHTFSCKIFSDANKFYDPFPGYEERSEYVNVTDSNDTVPPTALEWNVIDVNLGIEGKEINIYRGDELNFWSVWDENLSAAWAEYTVSGTTTVQTNGVVDGNRAYVIIDTNSAWSRGLHTIITRGVDEANNVSLDANSAEVNVYVWVKVSVEWVSPTGTVNRDSDMNAVCRVYEEDTNSGVGTYTVAFYSSLNGGTYLGSSDTNAEGYATLFVDLNDYYGTYDFWCQITDDPTRYYEANITTDTETITVAALNLKATRLEVNVAQPAQEGIPVLIEGNVWNQYDPVDANVEIRIERREGSSWNLFSDYIVPHTFEANEENTFTYTWYTYPGTYRISIIADPDNTVSEENEADNSLSIEYNVHSWSEVYGEVNMESLLASSATDVFYVWQGGASGVVVFYDGDFNTIDPDLISPMDVNDIRLADDVLDMNGSWDSLYNVYTGGDGTINNYYTFLINGRAVTMPVIYESNWPVGIGYAGTSFDGNQPIVFVAEINWDAPCPYGTCDYYAKIPALLRKQVTTTEEVKSIVVPS